MAIFNITNTKVSGTTPPQTDYFRTSNIDIRVSNTDIKLGQIIL